MPLYNSPSLLKTLAQKELANQIINSGLRMLQTVSSKQDGEQTCPEQQMECVVETCKKVQEMISFLPLNVVEDIVPVIFRQLDDMYCEMLPLMPHQSDVKYLKMFVDSILTARVTKLEINWKWKYIAYFIMANREFLSNLKQITVHKKKLKEGLTISLEECQGPDSTLSIIELLRRVQKKITESEMKEKCVIQSSKESQMYNGFLYKEIPFQYCNELEHLTLQAVCTDELLCHLSEICRKLKTLNISHSRSVSENSIPYISEFKELIILDMTDTSIPTTEVEAMFTKMSENGISLKSLTIDTVSYSVLDVLADCFPDLLELVCLCNTLKRNEPLQKGLPKLKTYRTGLVMEFDTQINLLNSVAQHLQELQFDYSQIDVAVILQRCPALRILKINVPYILESTDVTCFDKLEELSIETKCDQVSRVLNHCYNLRKLKLITDELFYTSKLAEVLQKNPFKHLEELIIGVNVPYEALGSITEHCKKLRKLTMLTDNLLNTDVLWTLHPGVEVAYGEKTRMIPKGGDAIALSNWSFLRTFKMFSCNVSNYQGKS